MRENILADPHFQQLKEYLIEETGLAFYTNREAILANRCATHMTQYNQPNCQTLLAQLQNNPHERDALIANLTVGETYFFRHTEFFNALRDIVIPHIIARKQTQKTLSIWSAGCSTGPEPYSVAVMLKTMFGTALSGWNITLVGTDINSHFLAQATTGIYEEWVLRDMTEQAKSNYFISHNMSWSLKPEYRQHTSFVQHNLVQQPFLPPPGLQLPVDLILCRNVLIYFDNDIKNKIIQGFHQYLSPEGWLGVGHADPNQWNFQNFRAVQAPGITLYQKGAQKGAAPQQTPFVPTWHPPQWTQTVPPLPQVAQHKKQPAPKVQSPPNDKIKSSSNTIRELANRGAYEEAIQEINTLLTTDPFNATLHFYHGLILSSQNQHALAQRALKQALYLSPDFVMAHYHLGILLQRMGHHQQAQRALLNARDIAKSHTPDDVLEASDGLCAAELITLIDLHVNTRVKT